MKSYKELKKIEKMYIVGLLLTMVVSCVYFYFAVYDESNYTTIITCGDETYEFEGRMPDSKQMEVCPEAAANMFITNFNINLTDGNING